jgi:hypothetical protein
MRSQVQVLAGPPLFSQLRALPPPGRSHPLPAWAASGPHALRAVASKPSRSRPPSAQVMVGLITAIMSLRTCAQPCRRWANLAAYPAPYRRAGPAHPAPPGRPSGRAWPLAETFPTTTAKPTPPLASTAWASFERQAPTRADDQPVVDTVRGDHADSGRPRRVAARRIGALDELTRFGHSRRGNARIADTGRPDARTPNWTPDTGRPHRTRTPGRLDAHTGHWTPVAWTPHAWTLDAHTGHSTSWKNPPARPPRAGRAASTGPLPPPMDWSRCPGPPPGRWTPGLCGRGR